MPKLGLIGVLAAAALFAHGARAADDAAKERQEAKEEAQEAAKATQEEAKDQAKETRDQMSQGTGSGAQAGATQEKRHPMFEGKNNFDVDGKVQKVSGNSITLQRDELPPATLQISQYTKVEVDGEQASAKQLKPGQEVKASFNLRGDKAEAVEIKAEKMQ